MRTDAVGGAGPKAARSREGGQGDGPVEEGGAAPQGDMTVRRDGPSDAEDDGVNGEHKKHHDDDEHRSVDDIVDCTTTNNNNNKKYTIVALYKFQRIDELSLESLKSELVALLQSYEALGNLLLATEGINGTICYPTPATRHGEDADDDAEEDPVRQYLLNKFPRAMMRVSYAPQNVFFRLRIRIKAEVVTMGVPDVNLVTASEDENGEVDGEEGDSNRVVEEEVNPQSDSDSNGNNKSPDKPGKYVGPTQWNDLLKDPTTLVIDTRNEYEIMVGTFENAVNPHTTSFVEFPQWLEQQLLTKETLSEQPDAQEPQHPSEGDADGSATHFTKLAFFCTGGVRCEKATAYAQRLLKEQRHREQQSSAPTKVPEVYHLEGGILGYLESVSPEESLFKGECYVFDNRLAVTHGLQPTTQYQACRACRHPLSPEDIANDDGLFLEGRQCRYCADDPDKQARRSRYEMRHHQVSAAHQKGVEHLGSHSFDAMRAKQKAQTKKANKAAVSEDALGAANSIQDRDHLTADSDVRT